MLQFYEMMLLLLHFFLLYLWKADMFSSHKTDVMEPRGRSQVFLLFHAADLVGVWELSSGSQ